MTTDRGQLAPATGPDNIKRKEAGRRAQGAGRRAKKKKPGAQSAEHSCKGLGGVFSLVCYL